VANKAMHKRLSEIAGFRCAPLPSSRNDVCWVNNWHANRDCSKIEDMTQTEIKTRSTMLAVLDYLREVCPIAYSGAYL
jgi:hypothetical protein